MGGIVWTLPFLQGRAEPPIKYSKKEGLDRILVFGGGKFFHRGEGCDFYIKSQLKSEKFNDKNSLYSL